MLFQLKTKEGEFIAHCNRNKAYIIAGDYSVPKAKIAFLLPPHLTCSNTHFNDNIPADDHYTLEVKIMGIEELLDETEDWAHMSALETFSAYENKTELFWVAVEMVVDNTSQIKHFENAEDTIEGMKKLTIRKEAEKKAKKRQLIRTRNAATAGATAARATAARAPASLAGVATPPGTP